MTPIIKARRANKSLHLRIIETLHEHPEGMMGYDLADMLMPDIGDQFRPGLMMIHLQQLVSAGHVWFNDGHFYAKGVTR